MRIWTRHAHIAPKGTHAEEILDSPCLSPEPSRRNPRKTKTASSGKGKRFVEPRAALRMDAPGALEAKRVAQVGILSCVVGVVAPKATKGTTLTGPWEGPVMEQQVRNVEFGEAALKRASPAQSQSSVLGANLCLQLRHWHWREDCNLPSMGLTMRVGGATPTVEVDAENSPASSMSIRYPKASGKNWPKHARGHSELVRLGWSWGRIWYNPRWRSAWMRREHRRRIGSPTSAS